MTDEIDDFGYAREGLQLIQAETGRNGLPDRKVLWTVKAVRIQKTKAKVTLIRCDRYAQVEAKATFPLVEIPEGGIDGETVKVAKLPDGWFPVVWSKRDLEHIYEGAQRAFTR